MSPCVLDGTRQKQTLDSLCVVDGKPVCIGPSMQQKFLRKDYTEGANLRRRNKPNTCLPTRRIPSANERRLLLSRILFSTLSESSIRGRDSSRKETSLLTTTREGLASIERCRSVFRSSFSIADLMKASCGDICGLMVRRTKGLRGMPAEARISSSKGERDEAFGSSKAVGLFEGALSCSMRYKRLAGFPRAATISRRNVGGAERPASTERA
mmetsp:Transcript_32300/g.52184  ORF Transcript_32300/g.52184 Transcript_32300/m.52184 type:complete len:212 (-) Transcript_32300:246-881(-)